MSYLRKFLAITLICIAVVGALLLPATVLAAGNANVSVANSAVEVEAGSQFTVNIQIQPDSAIAGAQFDLSFNPALVTVNSVTEGNLFKQNGASTYFVAGQVNNAAGTVKGVCGVITTPGQTVSTEGTLATIRLTAGTYTGSSPLNLSNVIVGNINGQAITVNTANSRVTVNGSEPAPTPTNPPTGGGGLEPVEAAGGAVGASEKQYLSAYMTQPGVFDQDVMLKTYDGIVRLAIPANTTGKTAEGWALSYVTLEPVVLESGLVPPKGGGIVGLTYSLGPEETTFDPPITISVIYDPGKVPAGTLETDLVIGVWDKAGVKWVPLEGCQVDTVNHVITAPLSHFSIYAALALAPKAPPPTTSNIPAAVTPAPTMGGNMVNPTPTETIPVSDNQANVIDTNEDTAPISPIVVTAPEVISPPESEMPVSSDKETMVFSLSLLAKLIGISAALMAVVAFFIILHNRRLQKTHWNV
jgi:hypothetical protein